MFPLGWSSLSKPRSRGDGEGLWHTNQAKIQDVRRWLLQPPTRILLLTGPRGNGQSELAELAAETIQKKLVIRAGQLLDRTTDDYMFVKVYTRMSVHMSAYMCADMSAHICIHICADMCIDMHTCLCTCLCSCLCTCLYTHVCAHVHTHVCTHISAHVCAHFHQAVLSRCS